MKVLFVRSGNNGIHPISTLQGQSLEKIGIKVFYYDVIGKGLLGYLGNVNKLRLYIKSINPDLIHAHYSDKGILTLLTLTKIPIVVSLMGSDVLSVSKLRRNLICTCTLFWDKTIVKTAQMHKVLNKRNDVIVLSNGVNFEVFYPVEKADATRRLGLKSEKINILFCSDPLRKEKNFKLAEKAIKLLDNYENNCVIHFLKENPINEMKYYYSAADLLLMTSFYEGSPNVIKEAMACNCPIVSTDVGDVAKMIANTNGCFITTYDPEHIADCLKAALAFGRRTEGRNHIQRLDSKIIAKRLKDIYEEILTDNLK